MKEREKLAEAQFFFEEMSAKEYRPAHFRHLLSAFLSAARSVLQYAHKEAKTKPGGDAWYNSLMASDPVMAS